VGPREEKNLLPLPGTEPRLLGFPARSLATQFPNNSAICLRNCFTTLTPSWMDGFPGTAGRSGVRFWAGAKHFSLPQNVHTSCEDHPVSNSVGTGGFPRRYSGREREVYYSHPMSRQRMSGSMSLFPDRPSWHAQQQTYLYLFYQCTKALFPEQRPQQPETCYYSFPIGDQWKPVRSRFRYRSAVSRMEAINLINYYRSDHDLLQKYSHRMS
jgi:hypothetical protein